MQVPPESAGTGVNIRSIRIVVAPVLTKMHFLFGNDCCALLGEAPIAGVSAYRPGVKGLRVDLKRLRWRCGYCGATAWLEVIWRLPLVQVAPLARSVARSISIGFEA